MHENIETSKRILDVAQRLMAARGYNAFSYADITEEVGIRKASIHYYFPHKSDLARSVIVQYRVGVNNLLAAIDAQTTSPQDKLERYVEITGQIMQQESRICVCALLAAEFPTLPDIVRSEVAGYFTDQENWLQGVLTAGLENGMLHVEGPINVESQIFLATMQGAMLAARAHNDVGHFFAIARRLLLALKVS